MTDIFSLTQAQEDVARKVEKLLRLAARGGSEHEMASAAAKATKLLAAHGLTQEQALESAHGEGKRTDEKIKGGLFHRQRNLWGSVAKLNGKTAWPARSRTAAS